MSKKIVFLPYDMDTAIGINNEGALVFSYNLEDIDQTEGGADVYNGQDSVLWTNLRACFGDELQSMYQTLRSTGKLSYSKVEEMFETHQDKWPEAIFNEDAFYKYIDPLIEDNNSSYLSMAQGSKEEQRKWWLYNRFRYIDSKYNAGDALTDVITVRGYAKANITVTPYADIYASIKYGSYLVQTRAARNQAYELVCPLDNVNDTEIYIYSASQLKSVGDLSGLMVGYADFTNATKLQSLKLGEGGNYQNGNLTELYLGNNVLLGTLDVRNCVALAQAVDISGCTNIEHVYFEGTSITSITLPNGGILKTLHLPDTITNLTIRNQTAINDFTVANDDFSSITTLRLENVSAAVDSKSIVMGLAANSRVRLIGFYWTAADAAAISAILDKLDTMRGLDESGNNMENAQVSGTIHTTNLTGADIAAFNSRYPYVTVTADHVTANLYYYNYDGSTLIHTESITDGGNGGYTGTPSRSSTAQYNYSFVGWSKSKNATSADSDALTNVTADRTVYAAYTATVRTYTVKFYNGTTLLQTVPNVQYGGSATYTGSTPTDSSGNSFKGFEPTGQNITGDTNCYAQFEAPEPEHTITDTWAEILQHVQQGDYATRYAVGDTMSLNLGSEGYVNMQIAGFDVDTRADGQGAAHISWICEDVLKTKHQMNPGLVTNYKYEEGPSFTRASTSTTNLYYNKWTANNRYVANNTAKITFTVTAVKDETLRIRYVTAGGSRDKDRAFFSLKIDGVEVANTMVVSDTNYDLTIVNGTTYTIDYELTTTNQDYSSTATIHLCNTSNDGSKAVVDARVTIDNIVIANCTVRSLDNYELGTGTIGGWEHSEMRYYLNNTVKPLIPSEVRNAILGVTKTQPARNTAGTGETQTTTDDVWIPSYAECFGNSSLYYSLFKNTNAKRIKHTYGTTSANFWWLRSAYSGTSFDYVGNGGNNQNNPPSYTYGVALGFCI
ncbi:MAG TPA: hypothetical protein DCG51_04240 [Erysipelotrichaceae bacterium]|nr:hypothetical protein [Erysipelotrichaceae bacterium]